MRTSKRRTSGYSNTPVYTEQRLHLLSTARGQKPLVPSHQSFGVTSEPDGAQRAERDRRKGQATADGGWKFHQQGFLASGPPRSSPIARQGLTVFEEASAGSVRPRPGKQLPRGH